jgi:DNA-binding protein Fis
VSLRHVENAHISRVLAQVKGNKSRAAKLLGVSRRTLYRKRV